MKPEDLPKWLYKIGTGWIGWSPSDTRSAHMQEIILAYEGHIEKLQAIHGTSKNSKKKEVVNAPKKAPTAENLNSIFGV